MIEKVEKLANFMLTTWVIFTGLLTNNEITNYTYLQSCDAMSLEDSTRCAPVCISNFITSNFLATDIVQYTHALLKEYVIQ